MQKACMQSLRLDYLTHFVSAEAKSEMFKAIHKAAILEIKWGLGGRAKEFKRGNRVSFWPLC